MKAIMEQGTCSHAGKSIAVSSICRIFASHGYPVCPFKPQNMVLILMLPWMVKRCAEHR